MSIIHITQHDENIYSLTKQAQVVYTESPRYVSKFNNAIKEGPDKYGHKTMGVPDIVPESTFLKKHSRKPAPIKRTVEHKCLKAERKPPIPPIPKDIKQVKTAENFIRRNIVNAIKKKPVVTAPKYSDTRQGDTHEVNKSGLEPYYIFQKSFGKPPRYLMRQVKERERDERLQKDDEELQKTSQCKYITRHERENLLNGLKKNWEEMQKQYQLLPIITDTIPKILRKTQLERDLDKLEKDITLIEKHPYIYIYEDE